MLRLSMKHQSVRRDPQMIHVESRRKKLETIRASHPGAMIIDVTCKGPEPWLQFSPFFPHGDIPIPNSGHHAGQSVEGIWQGLKVFEKEDIDPAKWESTNMKGIKRSAGTTGKVLGHRWGIKDQGDLLCYPHTLCPKLLTDSVRTLPHSLYNFRVCGFTFEGMVEHCPVIGVFLCRCFGGFDAHGSSLSGKIRRRSIGIRTNAFLGLGVVTVGSEGGCEKDSGSTGGMAASAVQNAHSPK
jgi:hypothetical protein